MEGDGREVRRRPGRNPRRAPVELLFLGYVGFALLVIGAILGAERGATLANFGFLLTIGAALIFLARGIVAWRWRE